MLIAHGDQTDLPRNLVGPVGRQPRCIRLVEYRNGEEPTAEIECLVDVSYTLLDEPASTSLSLCEGQLRNGEVQAMGPSNDKYRGGSQAGQSVQDHVRVEIDRHAPALSFLLWK